MDRHGSYWCCSYYCEDQSHDIIKINLQQSNTGSNGNADQVIDKRKYKVDPDPLDRLFREINAAHHIQEVILQIRSKSEKIIENGIM